MAIKSAIQTKASVEMITVADLLSGLVPVLCRSPERLKLATGDRRDDQA